MKYYKRALLSIVRQPGKFSILFITTFVLALGIILSFLIRTGINETKQSMKDSINLGVVLTAYTNEKDKTKITNMYDKLAKSPYVKSFEITKEMYSVYIPATKQYQINGSTSSTTSGEQVMKPTFNVTGTNATELPIVKNGIATLVDGDLLSDSNIKNSDRVLVITKQYADLNNLKVGQSIELEVEQLTDEFVTSMQRTYNDNEDVEYIEPPKAVFGNFKIIGIIDIDVDKISIRSDVFDAPGNEITKEDKEDYIRLEKERYLNSMITPLKVVEEMNSFMTSKLTVNDDENGIQFGDMGIGNAYYEVNNVEDLEAFAKEAQNDVDKLTAQQTGDNFTSFQVISDIESAKVAQGSISSIDNLANIIFYVLIILSIVVLGLVITLFMRERRHEFGIYMALGEKKRRTVAQVLIETLVVGLAAFTLAFAVSGFVKEPISKAVISSPQSNSNGNFTMNVSDYIMTGKTVDVNYIENNYQISINAQTVIIVYVIGIVTLSLATIIPVVYVQRLNPRKILM